MTISIRPLQLTDFDAWLFLCKESFGESALSSGAESSYNTPGQTIWGAFEGRVLIATAAERAYESWFGGRRLPTSGIAAVTVMAEHRGRGILGRLMGEITDAARQRGAVISTLFPTAAGVYRRLGYETITELHTLHVPTYELAKMRGTHRVRRADSHDVAGIQDVYDRWASRQNGPISRSGPSFPAGGWAVGAAGSQVTVAEHSDGSIGGYARWRSPGLFGPEALIEVEEIVADDRQLLESMLAMLSTFSAVAPVLQVRATPADLVRLILPSTGRVTNSVQYMLKLLDVRAFEFIEYPAAFSGDLPFQFNGKGYKLHVANGTASCLPDDASDARVLSPSGIALTLSGAQSSDNLRRLGEIVSGDAHDDPLWDSLFGGRKMQVSHRF